MSKVDYHKIVRSPEPKSTNSEFKELENYRIEHTIDEGTFGKVKLGIHLPTKEKVAIKILEKSKIVDSDDSERIYREINFLKKLKHGNIIKLYEIIENSKNYYLIMEFAAGGELFNYIVKKKHLDDQDASYFFAQIINGIEYIHKNSIVHRDLKPENLLLTKDRVLKIIDFGLSNSYKPGQLLVTPCGSPCYASPEMILGKKYGGLCIDIWSIGIILYAMVCGYLPFEVIIFLIKDKNNDKLYKKILEGKLEFPDYISDLSKDLIIKILNTNPKKRIKLEEIKAHAFYKLGEKQLKKEESGLFEKDKLDEIVFETMNEIGFTRTDVIKNLNAKKHNNITTTYTLFYHKYKINPTLCEAFIKNHEKLFSKPIQNLETNSSNKKSNPNNINININAQNHVGNININILDTKNERTKSKNGDSPKNMSECALMEYKKNITSTEKTPIDSANTTKLEENKKDNVLTPLRNENLVNEEEKILSLTIDQNTSNLTTNNPAPNITINNPNKNTITQNDKNKSVPLASPKEKVKDLIIETTVFMKGKQIKANNIINNKFNTSMSYEETLNRSLNNDNNHNKYKASSPSERVNRDKNLFNLKKNQISKTFNKNIPNSPRAHESRSPKGDGKNNNDFKSTLKKFNEMDVIIEENENNINIKSIKTEVNNITNRKGRETTVITGIITNPTKIENVAIDFKKKTKNLSIVEINATTNKVSKKSSNDNINQFKSPQHKNKDETIHTKRLNSQTKTKEKLNHLQCSPIHRSIQNSIDNIGQSPLQSKPVKKIETINIKNKISLKTAQSPDRKTERPGVSLLDNIANNNNLTSISRGERNMVPRSISPIVNIGNFNNTTNSLKEGQNSNSSNNNINASPNHNVNNEKSTIDRNSKIDKRYINNPPNLNTKLVVANTIKKTNDNVKKIGNNSTNFSSNTNSNLISSTQPKKIVSNIPNLNDIKKDKNVTINLVDTEKKAINKGNGIVEKKIETKKSIVPIEKDKKTEINDNKMNTITHNYLNQKLPEMSSEKILNDKNKKEVINKKPEQKINFDKSKNSTIKSEDNEFENLVQKKQSEFACCTINDIDNIQIKLSKYCEEINVIFKDVGNSKYECISENFNVGLEFSTVKSLKFLKIYQINGNEQSAKELMKAFLNLVL